LTLFQEQDARHFRSDGHLKRTKNLFVITYVRDQSVSVKENFYKDRL